MRARSEMTCRRFTEICCASLGAANVAEATKGNAMAETRIFSNFTNPRVWKAFIATRMGLKLKVTGAAASDELTCRETETELGKVPCLENARDHFAYAMADFDPLATNPAFAPEFSPYLAKLTSDQSVGHGR